MPSYAAVPWHALMRAPGDAVALSGYMGDDSEFDKAIAEFAMAYAEQTERDWRTFLDAIKAGRITAEEQASYGSLTRSRSRASGSCDEEAFPSGARAPSR